MGGKWKAWEEEREREVRERARVRPMTPNQAAYMACVRAKTITFCIGPAGTGKTFLACLLAAEMLAAREVERVVVSRPLVNCDEEVGFLPGGIDEKTEPYMLPVLEAMERHMGQAALERAVERGQVEVAPLAFLRGRTFDRAFVILDEAQSCTERQLKMFLTRLGSGTKMVVSGDTTQSDVPGGGRTLLKTVERLEGHKDIGVAELDRKDICRHPLVRYIDERMP